MIMQVCLGRFNCCSVAWKLAGGSSPQKANFLQIWHNFLTWHAASLVLLHLSCIYLLPALLKKIICCLLRCRCFICLMKYNCFPGKKVQLLIETKLKQKLVCRLYRINQSVLISECIVHNQWTESIISSWIRSTLQINRQVYWEGAKAHVQLHMTQMVVLLFNCVEISRRL
jgi:hypothetical protein